MNQEPKKPTDILAIIPARGGSKSIPRKNLLMLLGKPLLSYSIEQAKKSDWITRIIVSTDDEEIARTAKEFGAEVPFLRPKEFAEDDSTDFQVFHHALDWLQRNENYQPELAVQLRPTGPARDPKIIDAAIEKMLSTPSADSLRSVSIALQTPYKMWRLESGFMEPIVRLDGDSESYNYPRQKLPAVYWQNGYIDIVRPHVVLQKKQMCGDKILPFLIEQQVLEIDYPDDIKRMEEELKNSLEGTPTSQPTYRRDPV